MANSVISNAARWISVGGLLIAATAHVVVTPEHLAEAPYMGFGFIAFTAAAVGLAVLIVIAPSRAAYRVVVALCVAALVTLALTRLVPFPQLADDVGNWTETPALVSIASEAAVAIAAATRLRAGRSVRREGGRPVRMNHASRSRPASTSARSPA